MEKELGLKKLFQIQKGNDEFWYDREKFKIDRNYRLSVIKDFVLGIYDQTTKLMNATDWKRHTLYAVEDVHNSVEQLIDITKYSFGLLSLFGIGEAEFQHLFELKSKVLKERWESVKDKMTEETKVVVFDIDGVVANYDKTYREFLEVVCGLSDGGTDKNSYSYYKKYGITKAEEEKYNAEFIQTGGFKRLESYKGVIELISHIKSQGVKVVLLTARPSWVYNRLVLDTFQWLNNEGVKYDLLLWDKDKSESMIKYIFPANVLYFIEDRDKHALEISHLGVDVLLVDKPYNVNMPNSEFIKRVYSVSEIKKLIDRKIKGHQNERN